MTDQQGLVPAPRDAARATTCWMCGIRLDPGQMMADGGSACADLRCYCLDIRGCTERWTSRSAEPTDLGQEAAETAEGPRQAANLPRRRPSGAGAGRGGRSR
jgi:hypothetical protein